MNLQGRRMQITLNGEAYETKATSVATLLRELQAPPRGIAVECNGTLIPASQHAQHRLQPNDKVEVISFIGGG